jgi:integrase
MSLRLYQRPGSPNYYMRGTVRGQAVNETCGTTDAKAAEAIRAKREWQLLQGSIFGPSATSTFLDAAVIYLEAGGDRRFVKPLTDHFDRTPLGQLDQLAIDTAARKLYPNGAPASLVRQVYAPMSAIINAAASRGLCSPLRLQRPKLPKGRVRWLTTKEARRLIDASADHLKPLVTFLFYTGARIGEALWLDWRNVDLQRAQVQFLDTKNNTDRGVPLHPAVVAALANLGHRTGAVFRRPDGLPYAGLAERDDDTSAGSRIKTAFQAACRRAGISDFSPHDCRHTWATWHYMANRDLNMLMRLGGWKSERMVLRYAHVNVEHAAPSIAALPDLDDAGDTRVPGRKMTRKRKATA